MSNLRIATPSIPAKAIEWKTEAVFDEDQPQINLYNGRRYLRGKLATADAAVKRTVFDLGSASPLTADHLIVARADVLKASSIERLAVRRSAQSGFGPATAARPVAWWKTNRSAVTFDAQRRVSSITDVSGNNYHLTQATAGNQPWLSRGDNLENRVVGSEDLGTAGTWPLASATVATGQTDPYGGTSAFKLVEANAAAEHFIYQNLVGSANGTFTYAWIAKAAGRVRVKIQFEGSYSEAFDLSNGTRTSGNCDSYSITSLGDGWYRISATKAITGGTGDQIRLHLLDDSGIANYQGDGTKGVLFLRPHVYAVGSSPTYLPTTTAPQYRGINGQRGLVFAGGQVLTNASTLASFVTNSAKTTMIVLKPNIASGNQIIFDSNGGYWAAAINYYATGNKFFFRNYDGSADLSNGIAVTADQPTILTGTHSDGAIYEWVNGVSAGAGVASGNTSDMTRTPLSVGGSATATYPFNGYLYEIIFFASALSDADRQAWEDYLTSEWITAPVYANNALSASTLYGPDATDLLETFTETASSRFWWVDYDSNEVASTMQHSKTYLGKGFDIGVDPDFSFTRLPPDESETLYDSGAEELFRTNEPRYRINLSWTRVTDERAQAFDEEIIRKGGAAAFFLYTIAQHQILDYQRLLHVRLVSASVKRIKANYNEVTAEFEELPG